MTRVGVRELRDGLSRYLADVRAGRELTVTDHGVAVARIVPVGAGTLDELIAAGRVTAPRRPKTRAPRPVRAQGQVSDLISDQRR